MSKFEKPAVYNPAKAERRIQELEAEVERLKNATVPVFLCDRTKCGERCCYPDCSHTTDITHAVNFKYEMGVYWEKKEEPNG